MRAGNRRPTPAVLTLRPIAQDAPMTVLIGVTPGIAGGWGKLLLMVPGAIIIAGSFAAFVETTSNARSLRRRQ